MVLSIDMLDGGAGCTVVATSCSNGVEAEILMSMNLMPASRKLAKRNAQHLGHQNDLLYSLCLDAMLSSLMQRSGAGDDRRQILTSHKNDGESEKEAPNTEFCKQFI